MLTLARAGPWLVCLVSLSLAQQQQFYTVLAPDTIRPNNNYCVAISVEGTGGDLQVSFEDFKCHFPQLCCPQLV